MLIICIFFFSYFTYYQTILHCLVYIFQLYVQDRVVAENVFNQIYVYVMAAKKLLLVINNFTDKVCIAAVTIQGQ